MERLLELLFPDKMNEALMVLTDWKWKRKWKKAGYPDAIYERALHTSLHISKNHPEDYEKKVLTKLSIYQLPISSHM
jgi:hypothetical protein